MELIDELDDKLTAWIREQPVFFVASAPSGTGGHVNVSPKGYDTLRVLGPTEVAYLDLTGSGAETVAHLRENGRLTIMFCAFSGPPRILRLFGAGRPVFPGDPDWAELSAHFDPRAGARAVIHLDIERIHTSCGYAVPFMDLVEERPTLHQWAERKSSAEMAEYHARKNTTSIDGLPAVPVSDRS